MSLDIESLPLRGTDPEIGGGRLNVPVGQPNNSHMHNGAQIVIINLMVVQSCTLP